MTTTPGASMSVHVQEAMADLLKQKLQTADGTAKCAEIGADYLDGRIEELATRSAITEFEKHMFIKLVDIMRACAAHLHPKEEAISATG